ncbi:MAG: hypothetical protein NTX86_02280 [Candidatus Dependentiae bacterium]|nr:hypothetical protein [Candidatus Dependentiae bacterium]
MNINQKGLSTLAIALLIAAIVAPLTYWIIKRIYTKTKEVTIDSLVVKEAAKLLSSSFHKSIQIQSIVRLSEPDRRNLVLRLMIKDAHNDIPKSVILKQALPVKNGQDQEAFDRFARDWAGLEFVSTLNTKIAIAPRFYGGNKEHRFILLEDLGKPHISLVDSLTTIDNSQAATDTLQRFMICLGQLHAYSYQHTDEYLKILHRINPSVITEQDKSTDIMSRLESILKNFKIPYTAHLLDIINTVLKGVTEPGSFTTFIHGDICPDNTFDNPNKKTLLLIDFEHGKVHSALLDATYLRMSMPTCWCAKALPEELIESVDLLYRQQLMEKIPAAKNDDAYHAAYVNACAYWMIGSVSMIGYIPSFSV